MENKNFTINWETIRDLCGGFYDEATFDKQDNATFVYLLPEVPRVLCNYYHSGTIEGWRINILHKIKDELGNDDPCKWFKMDHEELANLICQSMRCSDYIKFAINSMIESDYYRALNHIRKNIVDDKELALILTKALYKSKTSKVKIDTNFWKIF